MNDNLPILGYIDKEEILKYVTEEQIFSLVFGYEPLEFSYATSPFRGNDTNAGCYFERSPNKGDLKFVDWANTKDIRGINMKRLDCFNCVQLYFSIPNFYLTLKFIGEKLIKGKNVTLKKSFQDSSASLIKRTKSKVQIFTATRPFDKRDNIYWNRYQITIEQLIEDKVFPLRAFKLINTRKGDLSFEAYDITYAYVDFIGNRKKLYRPYQKKGKKFITNCVADDVGGLSTLAPGGRQLVITKSYKDWRVLKNLGLNVVWLQNEGMYPSEAILKDLCARFQTVVVLFDNDETGIEAANKLVEIINKLFPRKARAAHVPIYSKVTDPSDLLFKKGPEVLYNFLTNLKIII